MSLTIIHSQYYTAVEKDTKFAKLREGCEIRKFVTDHLEFQYGNVRYAAFAKEYSSKGWIKRKIIALPMALWSILVKTIYHLVKAVISSRKQNCYKVYRDLQAGWGHFISLFNDCYGSYHIQASSFHRECYDLFKMKKLNSNPLNIKGIKSLSALEEIHLKTSDKGYEGSIIFVDITSEGGEQAIQSIRQINQEQEKSIYEMNKPKTCHFGLACCFNFSIAIANKSNKIILFDYDPIVVKFNRIVRDQLKISSNSIQFKENLMLACHKDKDISKRKFFPKTKNSSTNIENLDFILNRDGSFLSDEEDFRFIKKIAEAGDLHIFQGNIYDENIIENIGDVAKTEGIQFSSLFISNVYDWDSAIEKRSLFLKNMKRLSNDKTLIVDVVPSSENRWTVNIAHYTDPQSKQPYNPQAIRNKVMSK